MNVYTKAYTRENCLMAFQIWEEHQCHLLKEKYGVTLPPSVFDVYKSVASVWYPHDVAGIWQNFIVEREKRNTNFITETMTWYAANLDMLEPMWKEGRLKSTQALDDFFRLASQSWLGLSISYFLPSMESVAKEDQELGMKLRERAVDFLELTDHVIQNTLKAAYPNLGDLIQYLTFEEAKSGALPIESALRKRKEHYIYYDFNLFTDVSLEDFKKVYGVLLQEEKLPESTEELRGQVAMKGKVTGKVRVLHNKSEIPSLMEREVLVTAMTTPDYLPAMQRAAAFITDEGGITCHAAIVARELKKPCIIGTKVATQVLKDGDLIEVDAEKGIVRILERTS